MGEYIMDKIDLIVDKIETLKEDNSKLLDQIQSDIDDLKDLAIHAGYDIKRNADDLQIHMKRTDLNEKRLEKLEEKLTVGHLFKLISTASISVGGILGAVYTAIKLINS
jgi:hypothetical protein